MSESGNRVVTRRCCDCGIDLTDRPALEREGGDGLRCLRCQLQVDRDGGPEHAKKQAAYRASFARWQAVYGQTWAAVLAARKQVQSRDSVLWAAVVIGALMSMSGHTTAMTIAAGLVAVAWVYKDYAKQRCALLECPAPPTPPESAEPVWNRDPVVRIAADAPSGGSREFDRYAGYPPDWADRKKACLERDAQRCQICGGSENLHVHHVWPVSYSRNHTLQNLITLCRKCHYAQTYFNHDSLVAENRRAKRRYVVSEYTRSNGTVVAAHSRTVGRRGKFWREVRQQAARSREPGTV